MRVRDLLRSLQEADLDAVVRYLAQYADASDAEEICGVALVSNAWTSGVQSLFRRTYLGHTLMFILAAASVPSDLRLSGVPAEVERQQCQGGRR
jgi:hypothetical protein